MAKRRIIHYSDYNRDQLFQMIDQLEISRVGDQLTTRYGGRVICTVEVSKIYEVFDFGAYLKAKIMDLEQNFPIHKVNLYICKGRQEIRLLSDEIRVAGQSFYKAFFILNSTDRSRRLHLNMGLYHKDTNTYFINTFQNLLVSKRHTTGVNLLADAASSAFSGESFQEQVDSMENLIGNRVMLSKFRDIIVEEDNAASVRKFEFFKSVLHDNLTDLIPGNRAALRQKGADVRSEQDFGIDAFQGFCLYMRMFNREDSWIIKKETDRILKITIHFIREEKLAELEELWGV